MIIIQIKLPCNQCRHEERYNYLEMHEGLYYKYTCQSGHNTNIILQAEKFALLFEMGVMALIDGYTREAVSSFASSLERFYEYAVELILNQNKINDDEYLATWKLISSQSERQLGAFFILYLSTFKEAPKAMKSRMIEFRNKVIHKGYIPSTVEVEEYGETILEYIKTILIKLDINHYMEGILELTRKQRTEIKIDNSFGTVGIIYLQWALKHGYPHILEKLKFNKILEERKGTKVLQGYFG